jgi:hypothetical protein
MLWQYWSRRISFPVSGRGQDCPAKSMCRYRQKTVPPDGQLLSLRQTRNCPQVISKEKRMRNLSEIMTMRREIAYETDLHGFGEYLSADAAPGGRVLG